MTWLKSTRHIIIIALTLVTRDWEKEQLAKNIKITFASPSKNRAAKE